MDLFAVIYLAIAAICILGIAYISIKTKKKTGCYPKLFDGYPEIWLSTALIISMFLLNYKGSIFFHAMTWVRPVIDITLIVVALVVVVRRLQYCFEPYWDKKWAWWQIKSCIYLFWAVFLSIGDAEISSRVQWLVGSFVSCFIAPYAVRYLGTEEPVQNTEEKKSLIILP